MRMLKPKPVAYVVPCDICVVEVGETCQKCGGTGTIVLNEKRAA
jgi:hypothetical protein